MKNFKIEFFKLYDRKIASGEIKFSELGISKEDFTALCTDANFKFSEEKVRDLCLKMKLNDEESRALINSIK